MYFYLQVKHFHSLPAYLTLEGSTKFEAVCAQGPYQLHLVASIYRILTEDAHSYMCKWAHLLQRPIIPAG